MNVILLNVLFLSIPSIEMFMGFFPFNLMNMVLLTDFSSVEPS